MIYGVGPVVARAVFDWFRVAANKKLIANLLKHVKIQRMPVPTVSDAAGAAGGVSNKNSAVAGKTFVFTGTMPTLERIAAEEMVRNLGGNASSSVSQKTDYLVAGENAGSKLAKAEELGVKIIDEAEFLRMIV